MRQKLPPGVRSYIELGIRFAAWAQGVPGGPNPGRIQAAFGVSRATAYHYYQSWLAASEAIAAQQNTPARTP